MNRATFFKHFELLADQPDAVARMRELVLELAVRGKLVEQNSQDEPAVKLLEKIQNERNRLIKNGEIRKTAVLPPIEESECKFEIPSSWAWVHLNDIGDWGSGSTPIRTNSEYYDGDIAWFKSGELNNGYISDSEEKITRLALEECSLRLNKPGDVLIAMYGATVGKVAILEIEATTNQAVCACTCFNGVSNRYLFVLLKAFKQQFINESSGAAQPNFSKDKIIRTVAPLPPVAEQRRIVAKVDELMALCDELEKRQEARAETRKKLQHAALHHLLEAREPKTFATGWQRVRDHFHQLHETPDSIPQLRQAILQFAVQGKLIAQNAKDESATIILERCQREAKKLGIKTAEQQPIEASEAPFNLPSGWNWARLRHLGYLIGGGTPSKSRPELWDGELPWVSPKDMKVTHLSDSEDHISRKALDESAVKLIPPQSLLFVVRGMILIHSFPAAINKIEVTINQDMKALRPFVPECVEFLLLACRGFKLQMLERVERSTHGTCKLITEKVTEFVIGLPPLAEQKRIVARVEELMRLCDALEAQLHQSQTLGTRLLESTIHHLLAA